MEIWLDKHRPQRLSGIRGQDKALAECQEFLSAWRPGQGAFLHGPPGVGKTLLIEMLAKERGLSLLRMNASDVRTASKIEERLSSASRSKDLFGSGRLILIDEVDGISGTERGAVSMIIKIMKASQFPLFAIANDPWKPKLAPLRSACKVIKFGKIRAPSIEKMLREICSAEGIEPEDDAIKSLARFAQGDLRAAISDLQIVVHGRKDLKAEDLSILGYRERQSNIFTALPVIFHSRRISATRKAIWEMDKDPDEVFWWIESNIAQEFVPEKLAEAYDLLSRANIHRARVSRQQNWRFKAIMTDLMSGISVLKGDTHRPPGFRPYARPTRIMMLGRSRARRAMMNSLASRLGEFTHSSRRSVKRDYLPYLRMILSARQKEPEQGFDFEVEDIKLING
jgi:replication factor C large subunit